jgi:hypothetical protein
LENQSRNLGLFQFTSPFSAFILQRWIQIFLMILSGFLLWDGFNLIRANSQYGVSSCSNFQLYHLNYNRNADVYDLESVKSDARQDAGFSISFLRNGCEFQTRLLLKNNTETPISKVSESFELDGFLLRINDTSAQACEGGFVLRCLDQSTSTIIGSSSFRKTGVGVRFFTDSRPLACEPELKFDYRPPWPLFAEGAVYSLTFSLGCILLGLGGALRRPAAAKRAFIACSALLGLIELVAGVGHLALRAPADSAAALAAAAVHLLLAGLLALRERSFAHSLLPAGAVGLLSRLAGDCAAAGDCGLLRERPVGRGSATPSR